MGLTDLADIDWMTMYEYQLRIEAYKLKQVARRENLAMQAWFNQAVQATKGSSKHPRPAYKTFKDFFDGQELQEAVRAEFGDAQVKDSARTAGQIFAARVSEFENMKGRGKQNG